MDGHASPLITHMRPLWLLRHKNIKFYYVAESFFQNWMSRESFAMINSAVLQLIETLEKLCQILQVIVVYKPVETPH